MVGSPPTMARIDFHVHTPASGDFLGGGTTIEVLRTARDRGVDIVVLADHNTLDGYLEVADQLDQFAPMLVLPGVEVTCRGGASGIHVIAILDPQGLGKRPRWLLRRLGLDQDERHVEGLSSLDVVDVCAAIRDRGGLAIAAHASSSKGVLKELRGQQLQRVLGQCAFDGIELSTTAQRRSGAETLNRLGYIQSVAVVSGTDSHRARQDPSRQRGDGPGQRVTELAIAEPWTFAGVKQALADAVGHFEPEPLQRNAIDVFREGRDPTVVSVWRANDRRAVTRSVAATASAGYGTILVGIRRGGQGGRGVVVATRTPSPSTIEQWIWSDVTPTPAVEVLEHVSGARSYIEVNVLPDHNPFTYCVGGEPLIRRSGKIQRAKILTPDHALALRSLRETMSTDMLGRLAEGRMDALREDELVALFPWRGYLDESEHEAALRNVAYRIAKASESGILRTWAFQRAQQFRAVSEEVVRNITSAFTVSQARTGLRTKLDEVGASRSLRRRVLAALSGLTGPADPLGLADESWDTDVLRRTCERLAAPLFDSTFESRLRDTAIDESKRTSDLIGALVTDQQVRVIIEPVIDELGDEAGDGVRLRLVEATSPVTIVSADDVGSLVGRDIALVSSEGTDVLAVGSPIVAVDAPVRDLSDVLRKHRDIARFKAAHVLPRSELLDLAEGRRELELSPVDRVIVFRSCVRLDLPAWWAANEDSLDLADLAEGVKVLIEETRAGDELAALLRYLALLPGDHRAVGDDAVTRTRSLAVRDLQAVLRLDLPDRVRRTVSPRVGLSDIDIDAVTYGGDVVRLADVPIVQALQERQLDLDLVNQRAAEACARHLKHVASPVLLDVLLKGIRNGWQTKSAARRCDEATYLPSQIRAHESAG